MPPHNAPMMNMNNVPTLHKQHSYERNSQILSNMNPNNMSPMPYGNNNNNLPHNQPMSNGHQMQNGGPVLNSQMSNTNSISGQGHGQMGIQGQGQGQVQNQGQIQGQGQNVNKHSVPAGLVQNGQQGPHKQQSMNNVNQQQQLPPQHPQMHSYNHPHTNSPKAPNVVGNYPISVQAKIDHQLQHQQSHPSLNPSRIGSVGQQQKRNGTTPDYRNEIQNFQSNVEKGKLCLDPESCNKNEPSGIWHNVPSDILQKQFGLLSLIVSSTLPEEQRILTHGIDLDSFALIYDKNKRPSEKTYKTTEFFGGPFADYPRRLQDIPVDPLREYNLEVINKINNSTYLKKVDLMNYNEDILFWVYYNNAKDILSLASAHCLKQKGWNYWI